MEGYGCLGAGIVGALLRGVGSGRRARRPPPRAGGALGRGLASDGGAPRAAILVVAAGERELDRGSGRCWMPASATRGARPPPDRVDALREGPPATAWRAPGSERWQRLTRRSRGASDGRPAPSLPLHEDRAAPVLQRRDAARVGAVRRGGRGAARRASAPPGSRSQPSAVEKRLVEWVAYHPLLTAQELAVADADAPPEALDAAARVARAVRRGERVARAVDTGAPAYLLGECGLRARGAARSSRRRVSRARRRGAGGDAIGRWRCRHGAHTRGVNRTFVRLACDARRAGWVPGRVAERGRLDSALPRDGRGWFIRPDGAGLLRLGDAPVPFLLEYDRGHARRGRLRSEVRGYRRYSRPRLAADFEREPWCSSCARTTARSDG